MLGVLKRLVAGQDGLGDVKLIAAHRSVVSHSLKNRSGHGRFLQISGFACRVSPQAGTAYALTLLTPTAGARSGSRALERFLSSKRAGGASRACA